MKKPPTVELVKSPYQPTKRELTEEIELDVPGEAVLERMEALGRALVQSVSPRWIDKPRSRR